jgi:hypothetical protein
MFLWKQRMFGLPDPLECHADKLDTEHLHETMFQRSFDGKHAGKSEGEHRQKQSGPDKLNKSARLDSKTSQSRKKSVKEKAKPELGH